VEREGMSFAAAPEYPAFPTEGRPLKPYAAAVRGAAETRPLVRSFDPHAVVVDILTVAGALAAEAEERPWATLVPHVLPTPSPGFPPYSVGARLPRTAMGRAVWQSLTPALRGGERRGREELNGARRRVGLEPLDHLHGGISHELALVATFPQLEYPRPERDPWVHVTGPLLWEQAFGEVELPPGDEPLVLVAPSTSQDPEHRLVRASLAGLADEPVRVLAATNGRPLPAGVRLPRNARVVDWPSYRRTMPECDAVICHGGHGTLAQALSAGVPVICSPAGGDMAENAVRAAWAGVGLSLPRRLTTVSTVRLAVRRLLADKRFARRAAALAGALGDAEGAGAVEEETLTSRRVSTSQATGA
jgi:UDP:flavonoid glycosyltransferase YjiC (YdhE family)